MKVIVFFLGLCCFYPLTFASSGGPEGGKKNPELFQQRKKMALERIDKRIVILNEAKACINNAKDGKAMKECRKKSQNERKTLKEESKAEKEKFKKMREEKRMEWKAKRKGFKENMKEKTE